MNTGDTDMDNLDQTSIDFLQEEITRIESLEDLADFVAYLDRAEAEQDWIRASENGERHSWNGENGL